MLGSVIYSRSCYVSPHLSELEINNQTNIAVTRATKQTHLSLIDQDMTNVITSRVRKAFIEQ